jgi:hypothetical protein
MWLNILNLLSPEKCRPLYVCMYFLFLILLVVQNLTCPVWQVRDKKTTACESLRVRDNGRACIKLKDHVVPPRQSFFSETSEQVPLHVARYINLMNFLWP